MLYIRILIYKQNKGGWIIMYRITGITLYPQSVDSDVELTKNNMYHIEITDVDESGKIYCSGYIFAEVQNNLIQYYQFSVDLMHESGEVIPQEQLLSDRKLQSIINAICGILFNNGIGEK